MHVYIAWHSLPRYVHSTPVMLALRSELLAWRPHRPFTSVRPAVAHVLRQNSQLRCCYYTGSRREAIIGLSAAAAGGLSISMSAEAQALPLVPKQELAPGLQVSRVRPRPAASA